MMSDEDLNAAITASLLTHEYEIAVQGALATASAAASRSAAASGSIGASGSAAASASAEYSATPIIRREDSAAECIEILNLSALESEIDGFEDDVLLSLRDGYGVGARWLYGRTLELRSEGKEVLAATVAFLVQLLADPKAMIRVLLPVHRRHINITAQAPLIFGTDKRTLKFIQREMSCKVTTVMTSTETTLVAESVNTDALDALEVRIRAILAYPDRFRQEISLRESRKVHVFVDASNIMISSQLINGVRDASVRLNVEKMTDIVLSLRTLACGVVVGSTPAEDSPMWQHWRNMRFDVHVLKPVADGTRRVEESVDDTLHSLIQGEVAKVFHDRHTLVLMTGDGKSNHGRLTFPEVIERALLARWNVELWSWERTTSSVYTAFKENYPEQFSLHFLDRFRSTITFKAPPLPTHHQPQPHPHSPPLPGPPPYHHSQQVPTKRPHITHPRPYHAPQPPRPHIAHPRPHSQQHPYHAPQPPRSHIAHPRPHSQQHPYHAPQPPRSHIAHPRPQSHQETHHAPSQDEKNMNIKN